MNLELAWSFGKSKYDVMPSQHSGSLRVFTSFVRAHRAFDKERAGYITAPLVGRRLAKNVQARNWLALDVDRIDANVHAAWRLFVSARFLGLGWPTASSTPQAPRERLVILLDQVLSPSQAVGVGRLLIGELEERFGSAVYVDESTLRPGQPAYLPLTSARGFYLLGDLVDTDVLLPKVPSRRPVRAAATVMDPSAAAARWNWVVEGLGRAEGLLGRLDGKGYSVRCPWAADHSAAPGSSSSTALLVPSGENGYRGAFRCLHSHCSHRSLESVVQWLQAKALAI